MTMRPKLSTAVPFSVVAIAPRVGVDDLVEGWEGKWGQPFPVTPLPGTPVGNLGVSAAVLGMDVTLVAAVGDDQYGEKLAAFYKWVGVKASLVIKDERTPMGRIDRKNRKFGLGELSNVVLSRKDVEEMPHKSADVYVLYLSLLPEVWDAAIRRAQECPSRIIATITPHNNFDSEKLLRALEQIHTLVVNVREAKEIISRVVEDEIVVENYRGKRDDDSSDAKDLACYLRGKLDVDVVVTAEAAGAAYAERNGAAGIVTTVPREESEDNLGAGDHFLARLVQKLAGGSSLREAIEAANESAGPMVQTFGPQHPNLAGKAQVFLLKDGQQPGGKKHLFHMNGSLMNTLHRTKM